MTSKTHAFAQTRKIKAVSCIINILYRRLYHEEFIFEEFKVNIFSNIVTASFI